MTIPYSEGTRVKIHSLGDDKEHTGTVCGLTAKFPEFVIYIVRLDPDCPWDYMDYSCWAFPSACLTVCE